jgi:hypothetical protein
MSPIRLAAGCIVLVVLSSPNAKAISIKNTTLGTTLFSDTFESATTVGAVPDSPATGSWSIPANTINTNGAVVVDDAVPGAFDGVKYLKITRAAGGTSDSGRASAVFSPALAVGETLHIEFEFQYISTGASSASFGLYGSNLNSSVRGGILAEPDYESTDPAAKYFYLEDNTLSLETRTTTSLEVKPGQWQKIAIDYTWGETTSHVILTVDGVSEDLGAAFGNGSVDRVRFGTAAENSSYYLDGLPSTPGDYNHDGIVDAADYVTWRANNVPDGDYEQWRENFNVGSPANGPSGFIVGTVPEPTVTTLLAIGICLGLASGGTRNVRR